MAKAQNPIKAYFGNDSYGRKVNVAQRSDGTWFQRCEGEFLNPYNGITQLQMGKWRMMDEAPKHPTRMKYFSDNAEQEYYEIPEDKIEETIEWGFNYLKTFGVNLPKWRLPTIPE